MRIEMGTFMPPCAPDARIDGVFTHLPDREYVLRMNRAAERADYDFVLTAYNPHYHDPWSMAQYGADHTFRLRQLVAHRPGVIKPALVARMISTLDVLSGGRISLHIVVGGSKRDQECDDDFLDHDERYLRSDEYLELLKRIWTATEPFDFSGNYYGGRAIQQFVRPLQTPYPRIYFGGASAAAMRVAARHADVYMMWGEPVSGIAERIGIMSELAGRCGRTLAYNVSFRTVIAPTEEEAWRMVDIIMDGHDDARGQQLAAMSESEGQKRLYQYSLAADVLDTRLFTGFARSWGGLGNSTALVGTVEQIIDSLRSYVSLGVSSFVLRGFTELETAPEFTGGLPRAVRRAFE